MTITAAVYLGAMLIDVVYPSGLSSARAYINLDWVTLLVIFVIAVVGAAYLLAARPDRKVEQHQARRDRSAGGARRRDVAVHLFG